MKSVLSILSALIFLAGQVGYTLSTHYCGGEISEQSIGFGFDELSCGMESESSSMCNSDNMMVRSNCCDNERQSFINTDKFKIESKKIEVKQSFIFAFTLSFFDLVLKESPSNDRLTHFIPPLLKKDIPVLIQSFLI